MTPNPTVQGTLRDKASRSAPDLERWGIVSRTLLLLLVPCGIALGACSPFGVLTQCHTALEWPISLAPGTYESPEFATKFGSEQYSVTLVTHRGALPFREHACYLGTELPKDCENYSPQVSLSWEIVGRDGLVSKGVQKGLASRAGFTKEEVSRPFMAVSAPNETRANNKFTPFLAAEGEKYRMRLTVTDSGERLNPTRPRIEIRTCYNPATNDL